MRGGTIEPNRGARRLSHAEATRCFSTGCSSSCPGLGAHGPTTFQNLWVYKTFEDIRRSSV